MYKLLPLAVCGVLLLLGREYYKAVRHELYQVWDTINEMKGAEYETAE